MYNHFVVNEVYEDLVNDTCWRILWIDSDYEQAYIINLNSKGMPKSEFIIELSRRVEENEWKKNVDTNLRLMLLEDCTPSERLAYEEAWGLIKDLATNEPRIYGKKRGQLIKEVANTRKVDFQRIYRLLKKYWREGKTSLALVPNYSARGGKSKTKNSHHVKLGRPTKYGSEGCIITDEIKQFIRKSIKKHYLTSKKTNLKFAYEMMLEEYFYENKYVVDGVEKVILKSPDLYPTIRQFRYWYKQLFDSEDVLKKRLGEKAFQRNHRVKIGKTTNDVYGPGHRFQVDSTRGNVYLVSSFNRSKGVGRPVVYFMIDVFSKLITGFYAEIESASWRTASFVIRNAASDKVAYCEKLGVTIPESMWPSQHLPQKILADRGEFLSKNALGLIENMGVSVENTASYRADMKGDVEQLFHRMDEYYKPFLPGYIQTDFGERGAKDYRLGAKLTIEEYRKIILQFVLYHNNHSLETYLLDAEMMSNGVEPIPSKLWEWGIQHRSGKLRTFPEDFVRLMTSPRKEGSVTKDGIRYRKYHYSCEKAIIENWFFHAGEKGAWKVKISINPDNVGVIYIHYDGELLECMLLEQYQSFNGMSYEEVDQMEDEYKVLKKELAHSNQQLKSDGYQTMKSIVNGATTETNAAQAEAGYITKKEKIGSIRENRAEEKEQHRLLNQQIEPKQNVHLSEKDEEEDLPEYPSIEHLRKKRGLHGRRRLGGN
ncbi:DNA-binding protein [Gottfriedia sp. NPDC056225]|uniref:DNA-binding protein n=1 Tax=Gottfriedia sp. NPDC056225 TaxID=3345751 RepID=UPI0035E0096F